VKARKWIGSLREVRPCDVTFGATAAACPSSAPA
jgi:hypothetical protein